MSLSQATLHHVGYVVRDMPRAITQFKNEGATLVLGPTDDPLQRVACALLRPEGGVDIELVAPIDIDDSPLESRLRRGGGLDHLCYSVVDVEAALAREQQVGSTIVCDPVHAVTFGETIAFVMRRSGILVEYMSCGA